MKKILALILIAMLALLLTGCGEFYKEMDLSLNIDDIHKLLGKPNKTSDNDEDNYKDLDTDNFYYENYFNTDNFIRGIKLSSILIKYNPDKTEIKKIEAYSVVDYEIIDKLVNTYTEKYGEPEKTDYELRIIYKWNDENEYIELTIFPSEEIFLLDYGYLMDDTGLSLDAGKKQVETEIKQEETTTLSAREVKQKILDELQRPFGNTRTKFEEVLLARAPEGTEKIDNITIATVEENEKVGAQNPITIYGKFYAYDKYGSLTDICKYSVGARIESWGSISFSDATVE